MRLFLCVINVLTTSILLFSSHNSFADEIQQKTHVVIAMPFRGPEFPLDPHWYTPEYVDYIAKFLPSDRYELSGYFVSLTNIPTFLDDMRKLYDQNENLCVLNFCDGAEWDGYPSLSVAQQWEKHAVAKLIPISGANSSFILNSDDKSIMLQHLSHANIKVFPQGCIPSSKVSEIELTSLIVKQGLNTAWPLFCKLNIGAGALGIDDSSICHDMPELIVQIQKMHEKFPLSDLIIQPYLPGPEYTVLVLKDQVYAAVRRDFNNQYNVMSDDFMRDANAVDEIVYFPAPLALHELALKAIDAIPGKHHYSRIDMRDDGKGNTYIIDINDRPAFGEPSTVNRMLDFNHLNEAQLWLDIVATTSLSEI